MGRASVLDARTLRRFGLAEVDVLTEGLDTGVIEASSFFSLAKSSVFDLALVGTVVAMGLATERLV